MSENARPWMPDTAYDVATVALALKDRVAGWSREWLAREDVRVTSCEAYTSSSAIDTIRSDTSAGQMKLPPRSRRTMLEFALVVDLSEVTLLDADRQVLDRLVEDMTQDLLTRIGLPKDDDDFPGTSSIALTARGRELCTLLLPQAGVARLIRAAYPRTAPARPLITRRRALGASRVTVDGLLGRGALSIGELEGLSVGDIVLLDGTSTDKAALRLDPRHDIVGRATLGRSGDHPSLCL
jgi:hypothetical protein